ncbi:MAG: hypothetical protein ACLR4A_14085 [Christensenellales bacterium]
MITLTDAPRALVSVYCDYFATVRHDAERLLKSPSLSSPFMLIMLTENIDVVFAEISISAIQKSVNLYLAYEISRAA